MAVVLVLVLVWLRVLMCDSVVMRAAKLAVRSLG